MHQTKRRKLVSELSSRHRRRLVAVQNSCFSKKKQDFIVTPTDSNPLTSEEDSHSVSPVEQEKHSSESMIPDITASTQTKSAPHEDERRLENKIDMLLTMVNSMSLKLDELNEKLKHIEVSQQPTNTDLKFFLENLPCDNVDDIKKLNEYVEKEENKDNFIKYLQTIGGAHPKDKVNRIMKAIMTNKFAISCSWMGLRNNMKASDFLCFQIAQSFASQSFIQSADFEKVAAEWLRLATLRFKRQK